MHKQVLAIAFISLSAMLPMEARAQEFNGVTVFGDSLSDNGNVFKATGNRLPPSPPYFQGRASNGPVWVENLGADVTITTTVANFAFFGAQSSTFNAENLKFPPGALPTPLPGLQTEIDTTLQATPRLNKDSLYIVWAGANDYLNSPPGTTPNPATTVGNLVGAVTKLTTAGAENIMVVNLPDLGKAPGVSGDAARSAAASQLTAAHNSALRASLQTLASDNKKLNIIPLDIGGLFSEAIAEPGKFGLKNVTQPCLDITTGAVCSNPDEYLFWDPIHPTAAGHRLISDFAKAVLTGTQAIAPQTDIALNVARRQTRDIQGRLVTLRTGQVNRINEIGVFVNGDINFGEQDTIANQRGFDYTTKGVTIGADYPFSENLALGFALSYANTDSDLKNNRGRVDVDGYAITAYSNFSQNNFYVDALLSYGWNNFDISRNIAFNNRKATASPDGNQFSARLSSGYNLTSKNGFSIGPTIGLRYDKVNINGYAEEGANSLNMRVSDLDAQSLIGNVGAYASYAFKTKSGSITPYLGINYEHEFANDSREILTELVSQPGIPMRTNTREPDRDFFRLSAGLQAQFSRNISGVLGYETILGRDKISDNYINAQIRFQF